ncbi:carbonic anhydrase [Ammoniphilus oxalaticus]|uniref:carbonic anhydrase n=1 Tax=Ammoniphilus oxalaticus TaxID=66863 RepID=A0A419SEF2_9BACL|nr:carbonic anhydrase [Ammoniphilus oxalaticus]RKD21698.1 carbonic anhydrase [Ammoniphilus oxalaticus]
MPLSEILRYNEEFVASKEYETYHTDKFPTKKMVILSCMDTRLIELLPKAMGLKNGDAKIIKNAGAIVKQPFGSIMRSILVAIYALKAEDVYVIGHHECGMTGLECGPLLDSMKDRGITQEMIEVLSHSGINLEGWLKGFKSVKEGVENSVEMIQNHPLLPKGTPVHGLIIDPDTGKLDLVVDGYANTVNA